MTSRPDNVLRLEANHKGRDWIVGDIHGEIGLLEAFFKSVKFDSSRDRLIAVGDLVDRGPGSQQVLELFGKSDAWFYSALGNHDAMMRECLLFNDYYSRRAWAINGSQWAQGLIEDEKIRLAKLLLRMPLAIELSMRDGRRVGVVHAETPPSSSWQDIHSYSISGYDAAEMGYAAGAQLIWGRSRALVAQLLRRYPTGSIFKSEQKLHAKKLLEPINGIDLVVMGHTRLQPAAPLRISNMLWIDTGAGYEGGRLTFVDLESESYIQCAHGKAQIRRRKLPKPRSTQPLEGYVPKVQEGTLFD